MEWVIATVLGVVGGIIAEEFFAWVPRTCRYLISVSVQQLPLHMRERMKEQWTADLNDIPGNIGKLVFTLDLFRIGEAIKDWKPEEIAAQVRQSRHRYVRRGVRQAQDFYVDSNLLLLCEECNAAAKSDFVRNKCPKCGAILIRRET